MVNALDNRNKKSVKFNSKGLHIKDNGGWDEFGPGVSLYFSLLKYLIVLFIVLFINAIPSLVCNLKGKGLDIYH